MMLLVADLENNVMRAQTLQDQQPQPHKLFALLKLELAQPVIHPLVIVTLPRFAVTDIGMMQSEAALLKFAIQEPQIQLLLRQQIESAKWRAGQALLAAPLAALVLHHLLPWRSAEMVA